MNSFILKTKDDELKLDSEKALIFTTQYNKKVKKNEFYCPFACQVVVYTDKKIYHFVLLRSIIKSDKNSNIQVFSSYPMEQVTGKKPYFTDKEFVEGKKLFNIYRQKSNFGLSHKEASEFGKAKSSTQLHRLLKMKLPLKKGGGF